MLLSQKNQNQMLFLTADIKQFGFDRILFKKKILNVSPPAARHQLDRADQHAGHPGSEVSNAAAPLQDSFA